MGHATVIGQAEADDGGNNRVELATGLARPFNAMPAGIAARDQLPLMTAPGAEPAFGALLDAGEQKIRAGLNRSRHADPHDVLTRAGRPVLMVPPGLSYLNTEHVVIAWKESPVARRAVADALTLKRAVSVLVLQVCHTIGEQALAAVTVKTSRNTWPATAWPPPAKPGCCARCPSPPSCCWLRSSEARRGRQTLSPVFRNGRLAASPAGCSAIFQHAAC